MPNNTALALYFGDIKNDEGHPRDGILFYSNAGKNITETDKERVIETEETGKKDDHEDEDHHEHEEWAEDLGPFGMSDVTWGIGSNSLKNVTADLSMYNITGEITITAYRPFTTVDDDDFKFKCPEIVV